MESTSRSVENLFLYRCSDPRLGRLKLGPIPLPRGAIPHQETKTIEPGHYILYERGNDSFINSNLCSVNIMFYSRFKRSIHWLLADSRFFHLPSAEPYCITDVYSFSIEARPCKSPTSTVCLQLQLGFVGRSHSDSCAQERPGLFDHGAKSRTSRSWWQFYRAWGCTYISIDGCWWCKSQLLSLSICLIWCRLFGWLACRLPCEGK